jgi:EmrB/QacA subfamily drug resistance transporter
MVFVTINVRIERTPMSTVSIREPMDAPPREPFRWRWVVLGIVLIAEVMDLLDSTIITIAAPTVRVDLGGSTATMQWWSAAYTMAFGVFLIVGGRLGDAFGRRRLFVIGIAGFTLMSVACALAPSPEWLIVTRALQGGFGALLIPQGLGVIKTMFPPAEMGGAFGAFGPVMGIAAICGPILAGWLVSANLLGTGWRMIFLINLPVGLIGLVGALALMPESSSSRRVRIDLVGVLLISAASLCIIYPLVQGREQGWPLWIFAVLALGIVLLGVFGLAERRAHGTPLIEPSLLQNRAFTNGLALGVVFFTAFGGLGLVLSLYTQLGLHFSALHAGLTMAPLSLGAAIGAGSSFALIPRFGRRVLQAGLVVVVPAMVALALTVQHTGASTTTWDLAPSLAACGIGLGWVFGLMFNIILAGVREHEVGSASGTLTAVQQLGNSLGVAVLATLFFSVVDRGDTSSSALVRTALVAAVLFAVSLALSFRLPKDARMEI